MKKLKTINLEFILAIILLILALLFGKLYLAKMNSMLFIRWIIGFGLGYSLSRAYMGFAGSVNRSYHTGSTKLMRVLMLMFFLSSIGTFAIVYGRNIQNYDLWINPINIGLILGGILFGFGMSLSSCCASGVLTDLVTALPRALVTLIFFCFGVFIGFPLQATKSWINDSWLTSKTGALSYKGVYLPDLFPNDGLNGYLGAVILTGIFCLIVIGFSYLYESYRKEKNTYTGHFTEIAQEKENLKYMNISMDKNYKKSLFSKDILYDFFVKPWTMTTGAIAITILFILLMGITKAGWGASTPYGFWFGKLLLLFGVSPETLHNFTLKPASVYTMPFFSHPINVQNVGIVIGTLFYMLCANELGDTIKASFKISLKEIFFFGLGGITMGFGTRLANGCNVGALYTPISNFSLSGWVFLFFLIIGGIIGNTLSKKSKLS